MTAVIDSPKEEFMPKETLRNLDNKISQATDQIDILMSKGSRYMSYYLLASGAVRKGSQYYKNYQNSKMQTVRIVATDWNTKIIANLLNEQKVFDQTPDAMTSTNSYYDEDGNEVINYTPTLTVGEEYPLTLENADNEVIEAKVSLSEERDDNGRAISRHLVFRTSAKKGRNFVLKYFADKMAANAAERRSPESGDIEEYRDADLYVIGKGGNWQFLRSLTRSFGTVALKDGEAEALRNDLDQFLSRKDTYERLGIPWHRGYLFHGPPGTGKTSISQAISVYNDRTCYMLTLSDIRDDSHLLELLQDIPPKSVIIVEDIDGYDVAVDRDATSNVTIAALLNAFDGSLTPNGCIIVFTSNHFEHLDEALLRPGRIDKIIEIGYLDTPQFKKLVKIMGDVEVDFEIQPNITPAMVLGIVKDHLDTPELLAEALEVFKLNGEDNDQSTEVQDGDGSDVEPDAN